MADNIEQELTAIKTIVEALQPLEAEARQRALNYATQSLGLVTPAPPVTPATPNPRTTTANAEDETTPSGPGNTPVADIRSFKEQKKPKTDIEMATLVAYYLKHEAPEAERKDAIGAADVEKYFVQASHPQPPNITSTLVNAKKAGYLENASRGKYKLNSVGHNLVAHNMPRSGNETPVKTRKRKANKRAGKKKTAKSKSGRSRPKS